MTHRLIVPHANTRNESLPDEDWRPVAGYEGLYEVSSLGRVRSLDAMVRTYQGFRRRRGRIIRQKTGQHGYKVVMLSRGSVVTGMLVHRLVAAAFLGTAAANAVVNHLDFDKSNNCSTNLEWCSQLQNIHHSGSAKRNGVKLTPETVRMIRRQLAAGRLSAAIADTLGVSKSAIWGVKSGRYWKHVS